MCLNKYRTYVCKVVLYADEKLQETRCYEDLPHLLESLGSWQRTLLSLVTNSKSDPIAHWRQALNQLAQ